MNLDRVTITGADDSVEVRELYDLSREFPFVEWGILVSRNNSGVPRFPTSKWITDLQAVAETTGGLRLSLHVCGSWVRSLLIGKNEIPPSLFHLFSRVQLNFHADRTPCDAVPFCCAMESIKGKDFIFQIYGSLGNEHMETYLVDHGNAYPLFDLSGGAGILPSTWPSPEYMEDGENYCYHGYAGGLGPDNLTEQIPLIARAAGNTRIWIDMESRVRSDSDRTFDLAKVRRCLEIADRWFVTKPQ